MSEVTVALGGDGEVTFAVSWAEPMRAEFTSRLDAERFALWLRATGLTVEHDGSCAACNAHHHGGHACPSCTADLSLRVGFAPGARRGGRLAIDAAEPDHFLIVREQHRIRVEQVTRERTERLAELTAADCQIVVAS